MGAKTDWSSGDDVRGETLGRAPSTYALQCVPSSCKTSEVERQADMSNGVAKRARNGYIAWVPRLHVYILLSSTT